MKIAIMTQPLGKNYGGIMQAWALQQVLKRMGHEPVTIDRQHDPKGTAHKVARLVYRGFMKAAGKRKAPINFESHLPKILQHTCSFIDRYIVMSERLDSTEKLKEHFKREQYDAVIVGSDQTWRPHYSPNINNYFLDFLEGANIKRIAYASSFGVDHWEFNEEQTKQVARFAKIFDAISVREDSGVDLCKQYLGVEATHVLDPTLLLVKEDYEQLIGRDRLTDRPKGVYTYFLDKTPEKLELASQVSNELRELIYSCQAKHSIGEDLFADLQDFTMPDVREWLAGFANARFVITDSFHGMVFSLIFRKPLLVLGNNKRGLARFKSLEAVLGLKNLVHDTSIDLQDIILKCNSENICINQLPYLSHKSSLFLSEKLSID